MGKWAVLNSGSGRLSLRPLGPGVQVFVCVGIVYTMLTRPNSGRLGVLVNQSVTVAIAFMVLAAASVFATVRVRQTGSYRWWAWSVLACVAACSGAWVSLTAYGDPGVSVGEDIGIGLLMFLFLPVLYALAESWEWLSQRRR